jgi:hypothetical protein
MNPPFFNSLLYRAQEIDLATPQQNWDSSFGSSSDLVLKKRAARPSATHAGGVGLHAGHCNTRRRCVRRLRRFEERAFLAAPQPNTLTRVARFAGWRFRSAPCVITAYMRWQREPQRWETRLKFVPQQPAVLQGQTSAGRSLPSSWHRDRVRKGRRNGWHSQSVSVSWLGWSSLWQFTLHCFPKKKLPSGS